MITIDSIPHLYKLTDHQSFVQTVQAIDLYMGTKTYLYKNTLKNINDNFFKYDVDGISYYINQLFKNKNVVYSNEPGLTHRDLEKINSIDVILHSLPIRNPLSLNYFGNDSWGAHPGNTRLHFGDVYADEVYAMVVDYSHTIKQDYPDETFFELNEIEFPLNDLGILLNNTTENGPNVIRRAAGKNTDYIELTDSPSKLLANPTLYDQPRCYRLKKRGTLVTVDDRPVLEKVNDRWQIYNH